MAAKIEPHADLRQMAAWLRQLKEAMVDEGFSENEAMQVIALVLVTSLTKDKSS